jgi:hypothetical protein
MTQPVISITVTGRSRQEQISSIESHHEAVAAPDDLCYAVSVWSCG